MPPSIRIAQALAVLSCLLIAFGNVYVVTSRLPFDDTHAYLQAAQRLSSGEALYTSDVPTPLLYRYAPWFAVAWIPLTAVPLEYVEAAWMIALALAFAAALWPLRRSLAGICLALLLGALLYRTLGWGNVQPLVVGVLVWSLPTRAGPWAMGVIGSLKPVALLGIGVYLWRREWRNAIVAVGLAALLWAPALLFDLSDYPAPRPLNLYDATLLLAAVPLLRQPSGRSRRIRTGAAG